MREACRRSRALLAQSRATTRALQQQLAGVQRKLLDSKELLARAAAVPALPFYAAIAATKETDGPEAKADGKARTFAAVADLIEQVERIAARDTGLAARLIEDIVQAMQSKTDPSLLIGILLEGIAQTVRELLPAPERRDTAIALCGLLWDRVNQGQAEQ